LGALVPLAVGPFVATYLPVPLQLGPHPAPLAIAAAEGGLAVLLFTLLPLSAVARVAPAALFRDIVAPAPRLPPLAALVATGAAALTLAVLVIANAPDRRVALWYVAGAVVAFALLRLAGGLVVAVARRIGRPHRMVLRLALTNLHRPGAPT